MDESLDILIYFTTHNYYGTLTNAKKEKKKEKKKRKKERFNVVVLAVKDSEHQLNSLLDQLPMIL